VTPKEVHLGSSQQTNWPDALPLLAA